MIKTIRSYYSCNNKTLRSVCRNHYRYDILEASYFYIKPQRLAVARNYYSSLSRVTEHGNQHSFYYIRNKCMLKNLLTMGLRERSWIFIKGDE